MILCKDGLLILLFHWKFLFLKFYMKNKANSVLIDMVIVDFIGDVNDTEDVDIAGTTLKGLGSVSIEQSLDPLLGCASGVDNGGGTLLLNTIMEIMNLFSLVLIVLAMNLPSSLLPTETMNLSSFSLLVELITLISSYYWNS